MAAQMIVPVKSLLSLKADINDELTGIAAGRPVTMYDLAVSSCVQTRAAVVAD
jgi:hypothetical protein